LAGLQVKKETG